MATIEEKNRMVVSQIPPAHRAPAQTTPVTPPPAEAGQVPGASESVSGQYLPEPSTTGIGAFQDMLQAAGNYAGNLAAGVSGVDIGGFQDLLAAQLQAQMEMQNVSMLSNVEKSRHETRMTPVRNIRVG